MKLLFVYNADSGKLNTLFDMAHKIVSPDTYECALCEITHGVFSEKQAWKSFRENSDFDLEFYHRDEFEKKYEQSFDYPVILKQTDKLEVLLNASNIKQLGDAESLINKIQTLSNNQA